MVFFEIFLEGSESVNGSRFWTHCKVESILSSMAKASICRSLHSFAESRKGDGPVGRATSLIDPVDRDAH